MGEADTELLLSWSNLLDWETFVLLVISTGFGIAVVVRPRLFWSLLLIAAITGTGPRVKGYFFLDEILTIAILFGSMIRIGVLRTRFQPYITQDRGHNLWFALWTGYMVIESMIGIVANEDLRITRWVIFYGMLAVLSFVLRQHRGFPFPAPRQAMILILVTTVLTYIAYLGQGVYFDNMLGDYGRFLSQDNVWAGSAYAVFPTLVAMPSALILLTDKSRKVRFLCWWAIVMMMIVGFYFDSRVSWLVIFGSIALSIRRLRMTQIVIFAAFFLAAFVFVLGSSVSGVGEFLENIMLSTNALWKPEKSDKTRQLQFFAGFMRIFDNIRTFAIGDGVYSHRVTIIPHILSLYQYGSPEEASLIPGTRNDAAGVDVFRTTSFTGLLIDTGVIGMVLLGANYVGTAARLKQRRSPNGTIMIGVLAMSGAWLLINNITDVVLLYLLFMPNGLLHGLSHDCAAVPATSERYVTGIGGPHNSTNSQVHRPLR